MRKKHLFLAVIALILVFGVGFYSLGLLSHQEDTLAIVEKDGKEIERFALQQITTTHTFTVGEEGAQNDITVSPEGISVSRADCPDQTCVKQGVRAHGPTPIVCLPHRLTIRFVSATDDALDATTGQ